MRKIATIAAGAALAAGVVLVPVATAGAATSSTAGSPVTNVHPRVSLYDCIASGGQVFVLQPGLGVCVGGYLNGEQVWW